MTFRGTIQDGKVLVRGDVDLPDGTPVDIRPLKKSRASRSKQGRAQGLLALTRFSVRTGIRDLAEQHDHYIYGTPKRPVRKKRSRR